MRFVLPLLLLFATTLSAKVTNFEVSSFGMRDIHAIAGGWYPVFVQFEYSGPACQGQVEINNPRQASTWRVPVQLSKLTRRQVTIYCYQRNNPNSDDKLSIRLMRGDTVLGEQKLQVQTLEGKHFRILLLGHPNLQRFAHPGRLPSRATVIHHPPDKPLPDRPEGYDAFQLIIACRYPLQKLTQPRQRALIQWIQGGGELLFSASSSETDKPLPSFLAPMLPVRDRTEAQDRLEAARTLAKDTSTQRPAPFRVTLAQLARGRAVALGEGGGVLVAEVTQGLGRVVFCGYDLSRPPLIDWPMREHFLQRIVNPPAAFQPTKGMAIPINELLSQPGESSFLLWIAIYLMCYLSVLIGGGIVFSRKLQRSPKVLLVLPTIVLVFAIAAPIVSKLLLNLKTHWQSLTLRYQRADGTLATEWSYFMAYAPGAVTTQVRFQHNDLVSHPPLEDKERQFYEHSVQGEQTYLDNVMLYLTGRNYLLARRLRKATRFDVGGGGVLVQPRRYGAVKVTGKVGGGLDKHQNAVLVVGEKAGAITWLRRSGGLAEFSAVLDNTPQEELWQMLNRTWAFKPSDTDNPWWLPLPPTPEIPAFIVFLEHNTAPPMEPLSGWRSRRHIKLWIVQVPVRLPTPKNGRIALPPATIGGKVIRVVREESNGTSSYSLYQKAFILPAAARNARRIWLRFDHDVGVSSIYRGPRKQLVFQVYNPRAGAWTNVPNRKKIDGLNYVDGRGQVIVRLQFESEPGKPGPPTRRLGSPPPGGPSFELRHLQVAVEMQP